MLSDTIKYLLQDFEDVIRFDEVGFALQKIAVIDELLANNPEVAAAPENKKMLEDMLLKLELVCLPNLDDERCLDFLKENLLLALTAPNYDLEAKLSQKIIFKEFEEFQVEFAQKLLEVFKENTAVIGGNNLTVNGKTLPPSLKNWLLDYESFPGTSALRTNLEEVEYLNKSKNPGLLYKEERELLLKVVKFRDLLFNLVKKYNSLPQTTDEKLAFKDFNLYDWLPGLDNEAITPSQIRGGPKGVGTAPPTSASDYISTEKFKLPGSVLQQNQLTSKPQPPVAPIPKNAPTLKPIEEIRSKLADFTPGPSRPSQIDNEKTAQLRAVSGLKPVLNSEILTVKDSIADARDLSSNVSNGGPDGNRTRETKLSRSRSAPAPAQPQELYHNQFQPGLSMGMPQNYGTQKNLNPDQKKQAEIDRKLEELEKRIEK